MTENGKPESLPSSTDWAEETVAWFEAWRDSPRTDDWDAPQWQFFFDTAVVHSAVYGFNDMTMLPELMKRLQYMQLTFEPGKKESESAKVTTLEVLRARRAERVAKAAG